MHTARTGAHTHSARLQRGLTLIELMVALLLGVVMSLGMAVVYVDAKRHYTVGEEMARMQENGRFSLNLLKRELNMAGLFGGNLDVDEITTASINTDCAGSNWALDVGRPIEFANDHDASTSPVTANSTSLTCIDGSEIQPNTDVLAIKRTAGEPTLREGTFSTNFNPSLDEQWYLRIVNYGNEMEWSKLASADLQDPSGPYDPNDADTKLAYWAASTKIFYIRSYAETSTDGIPTLCVNSLQGNDMQERCLVEGIEEMHIEFGIDSDGDGVVNRYTNTPTAGQMATAILAKVYLLVRSGSALNTLQDTKSYQLGQRTVDARNDNFMRRVFTTTVQIRNAILPLG